VKKWGLLGVGLLLWAGPLWAQGLHLSVTAGSELSKGELPYFDGNALFGENWGLRVSSYRGVKFLNTWDRFESTGLYSTQVTGSFSAVSALKTFDFRTYGPKENMPFGYLTAYVGLGLGRADLELKQTQYLAKGSVLGYEDTLEKIHPGSALATIGLYGGQSLAVIDFRLQYLQGHLTGSKLLADQSFGVWGLVFACGIGF